MTKENESLIFKSSRTISSAYIDSSVRLGIAQAALLVQDNLTECFAHLGCDGVVYREKYGAFWVFTKTKIRFNRFPAWREEIEALSFPIDNAGLRSHINTAFLDKSGNVVLSANQEVCLLSLEKQRLLKITDFDFPKEGFPKPVFEEGFERFAIDFSEEDFVYSEKMRSQRIDMSHHVNNIEYIKMALSAFSNDFLLSHNALALEVHYLGQAREGDELKVYKKEGEPLESYLKITENGKAVFEMKILFEK